MGTLRLFDGDDETVVEADVCSGVVTLSGSAVQAATGWELKPHGLCHGEVCRPVPLGEPVTLSALAEALGRPLAVDIDIDVAVAVLGSAGGSTANVGEVPVELSLPDVDGNPVRIAGTGTGRKTAVVAWSTWCGCRYELPAWQRLAEELRPIGLDLVTVALDDDVEAVRKWTSRVAHLPAAVDADHRVSDVFGIVNVPSTVWLDEDGRVVKPPTIAPGDDRFREFTEIDAEDHHAALRVWAAGGAAPQPPAAEDTEELRAARAERRLAAWLYRAGRADAAERYFSRAVELAPLDFSIRRASMRSRGQDPFGADFAVLWQEWSDAGRPGYTPTSSGATVSE